MTKPSLGRGLASLALAGTLCLLPMPAVAEEGPGAAPAEAAAEAAADTPTEATTEALAEEDEAADTGDAQVESNTPAEDAAVPAEAASPETDAPAEAEPPKGIILQSDGMPPTMPNGFTGELCWDGYWYYYVNGQAIVSSFAQVPDSSADEGYKTCYYDQYGHMLYDEQPINGGWYLFDHYTGARQYGYQSIDAGDGSQKLVYYDPNTGIMAHGEAYIDGGWYLFDDHSGARLYGFQLIGDGNGGMKWVYYDPSSGVMYHGEARVNGGWYLFDTYTGAVSYGYQELADAGRESGTKTVFYDRVTGIMYHGKYVIDGEKCRFNMCTGAKETYFKLYLDAGHGWGSNNDGELDPGAQHNGYQEYKLNQELVDMVADICRNTYGLDVYVNKTGKYTERQAQAQMLGCSTFVSIHFNASAGVAGSDSGTESYIHSKNAHKGSATLQNILHPYLIKGTGLYDRGEKAKQLAVVSWRMPAVLCEIAYTDNLSDMQIYEAHKERVAQCLAEGIYQASLNDACIQ